MTLLIVRVGAQAKNISLRPQSHDRNITFGAFGVGYCSWIRPESLVSEYYELRTKISENATCSEIIYFVEMNKIPEYSH